MLSVSVFDRENTKKMMEDVSREPGGQENGGGDA